MANWTYQCYDDGKAPSLWQRWYDDNAAAQGAHDAIFGILEQLEVWREPYTKAFNNLVEVKLNGPIAHRIFGFYGKVRQQFVVVGMGYHKDKVYHPKDILKTCRNRRKEIERDSKKAVECIRPEDS